MAVNTLIQKVDDLRRFGGRILVFICTNRFNALDPAILRRALIIERFTRPDDDQRRELLEADLAGMGISPATVEKLVALTGPTETSPGYTYSDIRTRSASHCSLKSLPRAPTEGRGSACRCRRDGCDAVNGHGQSRRVTPRRFAGRLHVAGSAVS